MRKEFISCSVFFVFMLFMGRVDGGRSGGRRRGKGGGRGGKSDDNLKVIKDFNAITSSLTHDSLNAINPQSIAAKKSETCAQTPNNKNELTKFIQILFSWEFESESFILPLVCLSLICLSHANGDRRIHIYTSGIHHSSPSIWLIRHPNHVCPQKSTEY